MLHMRFGFKATWRIDRNPVFLYLVTIPYFATYAVAACWTYRWVDRKFGSVSVVSVMCKLGVPFALAFAETVTNANPFTEKVFCYDDMTLALTFGSLCYGVAFVFALPVWLVGDTMKSSVSLLKVIMGMLIAVGLDTLVLFFIRHNVAPHVTMVVLDSPPDGGCLNY